MSVVPHTRPPAARADVTLETRHRWVVLLAEIGQLAHTIANTEFVPRTLRGNEPAIAAAVLYGDEVGLTPMQSLAKIAVIDGKPSLAAEAQRALILAAGHDLWVEELTASRVTVAGRRADTDQIQRVTWTLDDARRANLAGKPNWRAYPRQMLLARASAELARAVFADVIGGLAATEELEDTTTGAALPEPDTDTPTEPTTRRRRPPRRTATPVVAPTVTTPDTSPPEPPLPDEPAATGPPKASQAQLRKLFALFNERGLTDRDDRLDWANHQLERTIVSASELTDIEASRLIDALGQDAPTQAPPAGTTPEAPPTDDAQQTLDEPLVTRDRAELILGMRREAGVDDAWVRRELERLGIHAEGRVTLATIQQLTKPQASELTAALNNAIDAQLDVRDDE